jgi:hypothetical protein
VEARRARLGVMNNKVIVMYTPSKEENVKPTIREQTRGTKVNIIRTQKSIPLFWSRIKGHNRIRVMKKNINIGNHVMSSAYMVGKRKPEKIKKAVGTMTRAKTKGQCLFSPLELMTLNAKRIENKGIIITYGEKNSIGYVLVNGPSKWSR